jgi:serine/threonine-protein kinase
MHAQFLSVATPEFLALQQAVAGRYSLERELGRGGMGIVFLARDVALDRAVAIKLLPPAFAVSPDLRERFMREARTSAKLSHPNIVPIHTVDQQGDVVFFVMGFVDGESLGQRVRRAGPLTPSAAVRLVQEVAWALAYAHGRGVIHRDVKPDNILLEKGTGRALVTDFGIARVTDQTGVTGRGEVLGTVHYMSPEQACGDPVDGRSDLYSLGVTAWFALTGTLPFDGASLPAVLARVLTEPAPRIASRHPHLPPRLSEAIDRCLQKTATDRFETGEELAESVGTALQATREIPPQIRALIRAAREMDVWAGVMLLAVTIGPAVIPELWAADRTTVVWVGIALGGQLLAMPVSLLYYGRKVLKAGLGADDVHAALEQELRARVEEHQVLHGPDAARMTPERRARWRRAGLGAAGAGLLVLIPAALLDVTAELVLAPAMTAVVIGLVILIGTLAMRPSTGDEEARRKGRGFGLRLLEGRIGRALLRLSGLGLQVTQQNAPPASQRTEVVLGDAAGALYQALPTPVRHRFPQVPEAITRLERDAAALRDREQALSRAIAQARPERAPADTRHESVVNELERARTAARRRLATAVAALENIRLDLLRLQAGVGSPNDLTADLEKAREISEAVNAELAARDEVERLGG